jgi:hypothetical protein
MRAWWHEMMRVRAQHAGVTFSVALLARKESRPGNVRASTAPARLRAPRGFQRSAPFLEAEIARPIQTVGCRCSGGSPKAASRSRAAATLSRVGRPHSLEGFARLPSIGAPAQGGRPDHLSTQEDGARTKLAMERPRSRKRGRLQRGLYRLGLGGGRQVPEPPRGARRAPRVSRGSPREPR